LLPVAQVALRVEQLGHPCDALLDRSAREVNLRVVDEPSAAPVEDPIDELGMFVVDEFEEFDRQVVGADEQWLGAFGGVVAIGRPSGVTVLASGLDQARGSQGAEVLANGAGRDLEGARQLVRCRLAVAFQRGEHPALRGCRRRRRCSIGDGHVVSVVRFDTFARCNL
jgi:hypothetical protein